MDAACAGLPPFGSVKPMLPVEGAPFDSPDFLFEPKWDGFRCLAFCTQTERGVATRLQSRSGHDLTPRFPELRGLAANLPPACCPALLDGEIVALRGGRPDFHALQRRMGPSFETDIILPGNYPPPAGSQAVSTDPIELLFVVFDLLFLSGVDLRSEPLLTRRTRLESLLCDRNADALPPLLLSRAVRGEGVLLYEASVAQGFEGVVGKRLTSRYQPGRSRDWVKARVRPELDVVVGAYLVKEAGGASDRRVRSLLVGLYDSQGRLIYAGRVGSGWTWQEAEQLSELLSRLKTADCPFTPPPRAAIPGFSIVWIRPVLVARVAFREWTPLGLLRQPSWIGLRADKAPSECRVPDSSVAAGVREVGSDEWHKALRDDDRNH
ncbi:MAG: non-homologous end-joining DNA ligase [Limnochordales bacterium]|nr:non-homologous end-joining DNA ligase [Limnochordales bacterium]